MKIKKTIGTTLLLSAMVQAGETYDPGPLTSVIPEDPFAAAIRPITNPTLFDLAVPRTQLHAIYINHQFPDQISSTGGAVPLGGDLNLYALQLEYALNERTSIVATKDGYIDFNPGQTLTDAEGFANLGAGIKRALIYRPESGYVLSGIATVELPTGDSEVFQGNGDGAINLNLAGLKMYDRLQLAHNLNVHVPFDDSQALTGAISLHASYEVKPWFIPLIELNWYRTFSEGDGTSAFDDQGGTLVPSVVNFEGGDFFNLGTANADDNADIVILGLGFRSKINESANVGFAYEFPLTDSEANLMDERFTVDFVYQF